jgi:hypothetical protein
MPSFTALTLISILILLLTLVMMALRLIGRDSPGGSHSSLFWLLSLAGVVFSFWGITGALKAQGMQEAAAALAELPVISASEARQSLATWRDRPVVLQDQAACLAGGDAVLAARVKLSGEEEIEGEESDYVRDVSFGTEQAVNKFKLGPEEARVQMEPDGYQVVPVMAPVKTERPTSEYSSVVGRPLVEREVRSVIPCDARVSVTGILREEGPFITVTPLSPVLSIITDRPWPEIVADTKRQADYASSDCTLWIVLAGLAALFQLGLFVRNRQSRTATGKSI